MKLGGNTVEETWEAGMAPKVHEHIAAGIKHGEKRYYIYNISFKIKILYIYIS